MNIPKSETPETDAIYNKYELHCTKEEVQELYEHGLCLEIKLSAAQKELAGLRKQLQQECDHDWKTQDESFDHEFGTEQIIFDECEKCGLRRGTPPPQHYE